ncbi:AAA family ATPase [Hyphococcus lacteus]|uniref:AAA family ATPase n=1 Tax=Hyphococcus lacteus TaxID=3143536 RepID=A0ABV3Z0L4_9PROT
MYEQFFGLTEKPFSIQPDPSFLYWGRTHRLAYAMLEYGVLNHAGISVITGEVGCGKTTLLHRLLDQLSDTHTVALLSNVQEGRGDLLSWVLMAFGEPFTDSGHVALFSQLQSFFISEYAKGKRIVLIIDEAQNLSMDMLEELRLLSNINAGKDQLLQLILVGQPQLKDVLNRPELLQLTQRVGSDFHLTPLSRDEVHAYIETRLTIAGCKRRIFTERAIDVIAEQSRGVPRVINVIADTALVYAFSGEDLVVGVETIRNVIRDKKAYGVFGIASNEPLAGPIENKDGEGPDAFVGEHDPDLQELTEQARATRDEQPAPSTEIPSSVERDAQKEAHLSVKTLGDVKTNITQRPEAPAKPNPAPKSRTSPPVAHAKKAATAKREPTTQSAPARERSENEPSAITGVVVLGIDPKISPEAAIRSAGNGRAIVFVPMGAMPEAMAAARNAGAIIAEQGGKAAPSSGRARNAGYRQLKKIAPHIRYVQFIDVNCVLDPDWLGSAEKFMNRRPEVAIIEGRAIRRTGAAPVFATLAGQKKNETPGEIVTVARNAAFVRTDAFEAAGGYRGDLLACEMDDLCIRQRRRGAHIWRLDADMIIHEPRRGAGNGWWQRSIQSGFDSAYAMSLHGSPPERHGVNDTVFSVLWGGAIPISIVLAAGLGGLAASMFAPLTPAPLVALGILLLGAAVYGIKIFASVLRRGVFSIEGWRGAFGAVFGRIPQCLGVLRFWTGGSRPTR